MSGPLSVLTGWGLIAAVLGMLVFVAVVVAPRTKRPSSALAWILVVTFVPVLGLFLFLFIGNRRLPRGRREKQQELNQLFTERSSVLPDITHGLEVPLWLPALARLNRKVGALPLLDGNEARLLTDFDDQLASMVRAITAAHRYVHLEFYILSYDHSTARIFAALQDARRRGVTVRVLLDHLGSRKYPGYRRARSELDRMGADWRLMLPVQPWRGRYQRPDLRNHRKLLVVDGEVAFVGSLNLIDCGYQRRVHPSGGALQWRDVISELQGPAVRAVDAVFTTDWYSETDELLLDAKDSETSSPSRGGLLAQVCPSGPAFGTDNNLSLFNSLLYQAERRVSIASPYFVPDESLLAAIMTAARRGVAVELFVSEIGDHFFASHAQHSHYTDLLEAGVRVYLYPAPSILHAKHLSIDDDVAVVGSSNMDIRSLELNLELMVVICGRTFVDELRAVEDAYREVSSELTRAAWAERSSMHRLLDDLARLTSSLQ